VRRLLLALAALLVAWPSTAEVSVGPKGQVRVIAKDGLWWTPVRRGIDGRFLLNPWGDLRGDLPPQAIDNAATGTAEVVWARRGLDYDVSFAFWDGRGWRETSLGRRPADDIGPRLAHDLWGNRYVAWTSVGERRQVLVSSSPSDRLSFHRPKLLDAGLGAASEPDLTAGESGKLHAVWREDGADGSVVLRFAVFHPALDPDNILRGGLDDPTPIGNGVLVLAAPGPGPRSFTSLQPRIHSENGLLWVDWLESVASAPPPGGDPKVGRGKARVMACPAVVRYAVFDGLEFRQEGDVCATGFGPQEVEEARAAVRGIVLAGASVP